MPNAAEKESLKAQERAKRYIAKQVAAHLCPMCANPAARICKNKDCRKYRKPVAHLDCTACGKETDPRRLCLTHLRQDRECKAA